MGRGASAELRRQAGSLIILGFKGTELSGALRGLLRAITPGGVILFARNLCDARQTFDLLAACEAAARGADAPPLFRAVDVEGGTVDRLAGIIGPAPAAAEVAAAGGARLFRKLGRFIAAETRALGFNTDFAPVLDLGLPASRSVLGGRTLSADAATVTQYARAFLRGLSDGGVLGCGKHFPGLGGAALDSHLTLPTVDRSFDQLRAHDLAPYRALRREMAFVMVAHAAYTKVAGEQERPASLSPFWLTTVLRRKLGYHGLILTDDLEMGGVTQADARPGNPGSLEYAAVETLRAGADMFLVCHDEEKAWRSYGAVVHSAEADRRFRKRVEDAARRVGAVKRQRRELRRGVKAPSARAVATLRRELDALRGEIARAS